MRAIYIVDDDDAVRASLHSLLSLAPNLVIRSFPSGDAFLENLALLDPGVLLLDFHMTGSNGIEVLKTVQQTAPGFATVLLTGEGNIAIAVHAMKLGAFDFIEKPYDAETLLAIVDSSFARLEEDTAAGARTEEARRKVALLSPRERDVLMGLIEGRANKVIAHQLSISPRTVEIYRANLMSKLAVKSLSQALRIAFAAGLLPPD